MTSEQFPELKDRATSEVPAIARNDEFGVYEVIECPECGGEAFAYKDVEYACRECQVGSRLLSKKANYGPRWERVREWVRSRDNHECQNCGSSGGELHVHHKTKLVWFESVQQANKPENLVTLCPECHEEVEEAPVRRTLPGGRTI